ncbi:MAG: glycosyltransferase family 2 protein [Phycisphaerae bacterium]|nr:glycosyltransferase family 2 protein [Phycisphaerae bacterium]
MPDQSTQPIELSVVIPAFNEALRIGRTLSQLAAYAEASGQRIEVLVVDDGSGDDTADIVKDFTAEHVRVRLVRNEGNRGKGYSVRRGMLEAAAPLVLMSDADLSTPMAEWPKLHDCLNSDCEVAIGSRSMPDSVLDPPQRLPRRVLRGMFAAVRRLLLLRDIRDTQCGFKAFKRGAAQVIFTHQQEEGFAFDCEVLGIARRLGYRIAEVGVLWQNDRRSTVRPLRDGARMVLALFRIRRRLGRLAPSSRPAR